MVRYSAPQLDYDHEDDGNCHPTSMDWAAIPDDSNNGGPQNDDDVAMDDYHHGSETCPISRNSSQQHHDYDVNHNTLINESQHDDSTMSLWSLISYRSQGVHNENHETDEAENRDMRDPCSLDSTNSDVQNSSNDPASNGSYSPRDIFQLAQQFVQHSQFLHQQQLEEQNKRQRRKVTVAAISILVLAIVLKRHAPPPPPIMQKKLMIPVFVTDNPNNYQNFASSTLGDGLKTLRESHDSDSLNDATRTTVITQHDNWESYCRHLFIVVYHMISYFTHDVAWYAISNSFRYAAEEIGDEFINLCQQTNAVVASLIEKLTTNRISDVTSDGENRHDIAAEGLLAYWKMKLISLFGVWRGATKNVQPPHNHPSHSVLQTQQSMFDAHQKPITQKCPIRLPAASIRHTQLPRGAIPSAASSSSSIVEGLSTEEFLAQAGAPLSSQSLALRLIAEGIDSWGSSLVESAPASLVHRMATVGIRSFPKTKDEMADNHKFSEWILPPATGFLFAGPEGVGKIYIARRLAYWLFGHCGNSDTGDNLERGRGHGNDLSCRSPIEGDNCSANYQSYTEIDTSNIEEIDGILEINAEDHVRFSNNDNSEESVGNKTSVHRIKELIVDHIERRNGFGSTIIIQHIEYIPISILSEIAEVLSGKSGTLSYDNSDKSVEASCDGTVFLFTSKQWGTKSIFHQIQRNGGLSGLRRDSLISSIKREVDSHLDHWVKFANYMSTVAPFLPFQQGDILSILRNEVHRMDLKYQGFRWKRLEVSNTALDYFVGIDHVEYFDLFRNEVDGDKENDDGIVLTFSTSGAGALASNPFWQVLSSKLARGTRHRPYKVGFVDFDMKSSEILLFWCDDGAAGLDNCEEEWQSPLL